MKPKTTFVVLMAVVMLSAITTIGQAAMFTWTGGTDLDWDNAANWLGGSVPLQSNMGAGSGGPWNTIIFSGSTMPTSNVKDLGYNGYYNYTSQLQLNSGGLLSMGLQSHDNGLSTEQSPKTMLIIGDGIAGGTENVTLQFTESVI
ncbi:MAG: hypothetical protein U1E05_24490, partial [Patescibacteria group bacterium]|nr:hypothetical protein [Patescibacteria group bacterium]